MEDKGIVSVICVEESDECLGEKNYFVELICNGEKFKVRLQFTWYDFTSQDFCLIITTFLFADDKKLFRFSKPSQCAFFKYAVTSFTRKIRRGNCFREAIAIVFTRSCRHIRK